MPPAQELLPPLARDERGHFRKGHGGGPGRVAGEPNKVTSSIRQMVEEALHGLGGVNYLMMVGATDPKAFCMLVGKTLPLKVVGDSDNPLFVVQSITQRVVVMKPKPNAE